MCVFGVLVRSLIMNVYQFSTSDSSKTVVCNSVMFVCLPVWLILTQCNATQFFVRYCQVVWINGQGWNKMVWYGITYSSVASYLIFFSFPSNWEQGAMGWNENR